MSAKLVENGCTFPTRSNNGILVIEIGELEIEVPIPWLKKEFKLDNTYFDSNNIFAYFKDEEHTVILRNDGSVTVYNNKNIILMSKRFDMPDLSSKIKIFNKGGVILNNELYDNKFYIIKNSTKLLMDTTAIYEGFLFDIEENSKEFLKDLHTAGQYQPTFIVTKDEEGNNTYTRYLTNNEDEKSIKIYALKGNTIKITNKINII